MGRRHAQLHPCLALTSDGPSMPVEPRSILKAADLEMDVARREVSRGGRTIDLTTKEFALLEYFLRKKGLLLTRAMILDHVWDFDYDGGSNLVEVYVHFIETSPRAGNPALRDRAMTAAT